MNRLHFTYRSEPLGTTRNHLRKNTRVPTSVQPKPPPLQLHRCIDHLDRKILMLLCSVAPSPPSLPDPLHCVLDLPSASLGVLLQHFVPIYGHRISKKYSSSTTGRYSRSSSNHCFDLMTLVWIIRSSFGPSSFPLSSSK
jgi:hypothetical protein